MRAGTCYGLAALAAVALTSVLGGCTVLGTYVGRRADEINTRRDIHATGQHLDSIPQNYPVEVTLTNGKKLSAVYMGEVIVPDSAYRARYAMRRDQYSSTTVWPQLDEVLVITQKSGRQFRFPFAGFDRHSLVIWNTSTQRRATISCAEVDTLQNDLGDGYSPTELGVLIAAGQVPLRTGILLRYDGAPFAVPLDEVLEIHAGPKKTSNWAFGMVLGAITDALITGAIIRAAQK